MQGPWYFFHPDSPGYLQRKLDEGEPVSRAELVRVFEANPGFAWEGALHKLYCQMLNGSFKGKPGPRERLSWSMWQCINAWAICEYDRRPTPILPYGCIQTVAEQHELAPWMGRF